MSDFPLGKSWGRLLGPILDLIPPQQESNTDSRDDRNRIAYTISVRASHIEETANALAVNEVKRILVRLMLSPVIKSFRTTVVVVFAILLGVIYYRGLYAMILDGMAFGIGCMTMLLFAEISFHATAQAKEYQGLTESDESESSDVAEQSYVTES